MASHIDALCLAIEGKPVDSLAATRRHLAEHPRDAMVAAPATGVFGLIGFSGRQDREPEQLAFLEALKAHLADDWWFQSVYAFALEEMGRLDEALDVIERSMATNPANAHGAHIKAHVLYERGEDAAGLAWLDSWLPAYPKAGLMHCHISWHVAMFALVLGDSDRAWQMYRDHVHPGGAWGPALNVATDAPKGTMRTAGFAGKAIVELEAALPATVRIGGSRAQRDVVENTLIAAYLKAGRAADAYSRIKTHTDRRPSVPVAGL